MKKIISIMLFAANLAVGQTLNGVWMAQKDTLNAIIIATDKYVAISKFSKNNLIESKGGKYSIAQTKEIFLDYDFYSNKPSRVGGAETFAVNLKKKYFEMEGLKFVKLDTKSEFDGRWKYSPDLSISEDSTALKQGYRDYLLVHGNYIQNLRFNFMANQFIGSIAGYFTQKDNSLRLNLLFNTNQKDTYFFENINFTLNQQQLIIKSGLGLQQLRSKLD